MSDKNHFDTPRDMWEYFFQEYNAYYWHLLEHKCAGYTQPNPCPQAPPRWTGTEGYAELARNVRVSPIGGFIEEQILKKGQTVRIVMVSRFGDLGITPHLDNVHGYVTRLEPTPDNFVNCRLRR